eukprot:gene746-9412_t
MAVRPLLPAVLLAAASVVPLQPAHAVGNGGARPYNDPSGPVQTPDGTWHVFPINGNWGHCTSPDLLRWDCSHPSTGWNMSNTGGIT